MSLEYTYSRKTLDTYQDSVSSQASSKLLKTMYGDYWEKKTYLIEPVLMLLNARKAVCKIPSRVRMKSFVVDNKSRMNTYSTRGGIQRIKKNERKRKCPLVSSAGTILFAYRKYLQVHPTDPELTPE